VNLVPKPYYGPDNSTAGTAIIASPAALVTNGTITKIYSFNNAAVPANSQFWMTIPTKTTIPNKLWWKAVGHYTALP
jgi:hypothetical protein